jgi:hypothetical protein
VRAAVRGDTAWSQAGAGTGMGQHSWAAVWLGGMTESASTRNRGGARTTSAGMGRSAEAAGPQRNLAQK